MERPLNQVHVKCVWKSCIHKHSDKHMLDHNWNLQKSNPRRYNTASSLTALTKGKVWEWYGKTWAIYDPYLGMVWEGWVKIWNWYGAQFCHIIMYGKCMGRKADAVHCMGKLWEHNFHIYPIAATHLLALRLLWEWYRMSTVQYFIDFLYQQI